MRLFEIDEKKGSYAAVRFAGNTIHQLRKYQIENNIPTPLTPKEFHSTVMYSKIFMEGFKPLGKIDPPWIGEFTEFDIFPSDDDNALVLKYDCPELTKRWEEIMAMGAHWTWDDFMPHITLSYNVEDLDISTLPPYTGPIQIAMEFYDDLDLTVNWADKNK